MHSKAPFWGSTETIGARRRTNMTENIFNDSSGLDPSTVARDAARWEERSALIDIAERVAETAKDEDVSSALVYEYLFFEHMLPAGLDVAEGQASRRTDLSQPTEADIARMADCLMVVAETDAVFAWDEEDFPTVEGLKDALRQGVQAILDGAHTFAECPLVLTWMGDECQGIAVSLDLDFFSLRGNGHLHETEGPWIWCGGCDRLFSAHDLDLPEVPDGERLPVAVVRAACPRCSEGVEA